MTESSPSTSTALVRGSLRDQIRQMIVDGLVSGRWQPGDRIVERRIAAELEVSQAPVREALRELETLRIVESSPNKGARVRAFTADDLAEIYPVRAGLEQVAAELALPRLSGDVTALEHHLARMRQATDTAAQVRNIFAFHREIVRAAGNAVLLHSWESLGLEVWTAVGLRLRGLTLAEEAADHEPIVAAFRRGDPAIGTLLRDHVLGCATAEAHPAA
ncbi:MULTISPECIES: GntR family transcriptional regulator [Streptomycetaceae]|uniref:GntR family transcriptional regulator n=1 Tax=Streptantibioticus cattleyicolor (strain ATCC 35852 / DSM 46488 / JCM 4925 / NBRC 14057 / NRRL 8057) TaxID=1003195 RepID=F8JTM5_STREN|nr:MULTISPECIES: GntR family transcriptional regulator [Streptomycetaceae]AEW96792.1 GntR family transcriptional regulator [Streptantibioticus cattleyicolor NRRL 8057 = DSM 46488]MYS61273.1 FCD domain-containing protein [Streptomyces sp. SID5468]CCB77122.1 GntR-family transcriptional regulator [Streptantibioticus cattleyicolor NRRL 8057 = DSM 46488]